MNYEYKNDKIPKISGNKIDKWSKKHYIIYTNKIQHLILKSLIFI